MNNEETKRVERLEKENEDLRHRISKLEGAQRVMDERILSALNERKA